LISFADYTTAISKAHHTAARDKGTIQVSTNTKKPL